ncbi:sugar ABC transporter ATP-binding protein [Martelella alba]|uniref:Sugar ABC transporter ATP-binding protein n=1 Tax=Martelella alba TaxID=2590451 RepID=A0A506U0Z0_9HYPH|nr:sugar ABC transporter ATP-binding protein [Martelella alba]
MRTATEVETGPVLEMKNISKTFGFIKALIGVSLTVQRGEIHALMGENGAGKSTLMKILSGALTPDPGGEILVFGKPLPKGRPRASKEAGIAVIYQELSLAPNLNVNQNIYLGTENARFGFVSQRETEEKTAAILKRLGLSFSPRTLISELSIGERQMVEIARALSFKPGIIIMDEPTTSLTERESSRLFEVIAELKAQGIAIIYISHRMEEVYQLADRVTVLRDARQIGTIEREDLSPERLISMMVGRDLSSFYKKTRRVEAFTGTPVLQATNIRDDTHVFGCSLEVHAGEVVGLSGLVGAGRTELARLIFGADPKTAGEVRVDGKPVDVKSPSDGLAAGIAYLTEDRKRLGLFLDMSIGQNLNLSVLSEDAHPLGFLDLKKAADRASHAFTNFNIRASGPGVLVGALSGGNQQKVLLARLIEANPRIVILDEPTRGVDIGAKSEIYRLIDVLARKGVAILMISSELPEIVGVSDRVLVMCNGLISGEVRPGPDGEIRQEEIMSYSTGAAAKVLA